MERKMTMGHSALAMLVALLTACGAKQEPPPDIRPIRSTIVNSSSLGDQVAYTGEIRSRYESDLGFRISGKIVSRPVDVGAQVVAGTLLAQVDPNDQRLAVEAAQSAVVAARAEFERAKSEEARYRDLLERGLATRSAYVAQQTATKSAQSKLEQAGSELSLRRQQLGYTAIRADKAGVITRVYAEAGAVVAAGQAVVTLAQPSEMEAVFDVAEAQVDSVRSAKSVEIALLSARIKPFFGKVREVSPSADPITRTYRVKTSLLIPPPGLRLGMNIIATLRSSQVASGIVIPATALFAKNRKPAVWVVKADQTVELRPITVSSYETDTVVVSSGLRNGERIVTAGTHKLLSGQKVRLLPEPVR
jgi:RND family efflux transporter MFP subunit